MSSVNSGTAASSQCKSALSTLKLNLFNGFDAATALNASIHASNYIPGKASIRTGVPSAKEATQAA